MTEENKKLTRAELKNQFDFWTEKLSLRHEFSFDEIYDFLIARREHAARTEKFRAAIVVFQNRISETDGAVGKNPFPLKHSFGDGLYIREVNVPAQTLTVTEIHAQTHPFFLLRGTITIWTENGQETISAPFYGVTPAGTKRVIWHHDAVKLVTVQRTDKMEIAEIEREVTAETFADLEKRKQNDLCLLSPSV